MKKEITSSLFFPLSCCFLVQCLEEYWHNNLTHVPKPLSLCRLIMFSQSVSQIFSQSVKCSVSQSVSLRPHPTPISLTIFNHEHDLRIYCIATLSDQPNFTRHVCSVLKIRLLFMSCCFFPLSFRLVRVFRFCLGVCYQCFRKVRVGVWRKKKKEKRKKERNENQSTQLI